MENGLLNYMSGNEIIDYVNNYINKSNYNYAVLIDGCWGSGKTYFIKNSLIPALEANEKTGKVRMENLIIRKLFIFHYMVFHLKKS